MAQTDPITDNNNQSANNQHDTPPTVVTKLCHLIKRPDFNGYGFNLHSEKSKIGQYIGKVDANSPAEAAGLKEGDRIINVNGVPIGNESHKQVVQRIKSISNEVRLLLVDGTSVNIGENENNRIADLDGNKLNVANSEINIVKNNFSEDYDARNANVASMATKCTESTQNCNEQNTSTKSPNGDNVNIQQVGSLQLPITAAEMRAKLLSKKKYDPKNESVDLKKKFDIIQKL